MEIKGKDNIKEIIQKIGFFRLLVIVLAGVMLLVLSLPSGSASSEEERSGENTAVSEGDAWFLAMERYAKRQEENTAAILSRVEGIGKVEVMLTLASSEEKVTLQDSSITEDSSSQEGRLNSTHQSTEESILIKQDGVEAPYVVQIHSPVIEGVVVVAEGADSSKKEKEIMEAIQALFSIELHNIKVMKME